jgi:hypothetical protein
MRNGHAQWTWEMTHVEMSGKYLFYFLCITSHMTAAYVLLYSSPCITITSETSSNVWPRRHCRKHKLM